MSGMRVGFEARWRDWAELLDRPPAAEWVLGRDPGCDVQINHASVAPAHAQVILRRGRFILMAQGPHTVRVGSTEIRAPVVLGSGEAFSLGEVEVRVGEVLGPTRAEVEGAAGPVLREWAPQGGLRCFERRGGGEAYWATEGPQGPSLTPLADGALWTRDLPAGVRLASVMHRLEDGSLGLPAEVAVVLIAELGRVLRSHQRTAGPHGGLSPQTVHVGQGGQVALLAAHPGQPVDEAYVSPERRFGGPASRSDDAFCFASLGIALLRACQGPAPTWAPLSALLQSDPARRSVDVVGAAGQVRAAAQACGLDPSAQHLARVARLLCAERVQPLLRAGISDASGRPDG